jgi:translation initiation factor 6 (eIF-6)
LRQANYLFAADLAALVVNLFVCKEIAMSRITSRLSGHVVACTIGAISTIGTAGAFSTMATAATPALLSNETACAARSGAVDVNSRHAFVETVVRVERDLAAAGAVPSLGLDVKQ